jgi:hypothetical protein
MREEDEPRPAVAAGNPRDEIRPLRDLRVELARDTALLEVFAEELGGPGLVPGRIDGVQADQRLKELDDLAQSDSFASAVSRFRTSQSSG